MRAGSDSGRFVVRIRLDLGSTQPIAGELKPLVLHQEAMTLQVASMAEHHSIALCERFDAHPFRVSDGKWASNTA
jgi:hypothetical protein